MYCPRCGKSNHVTVIDASPPKRNYPEGSCTRCQVSWHVFDTEDDLIEFANMSPTEHEAHAFSIAIEDLEISDVAYLLAHSLAQHVIQRHHGDPEEAVEEAYLFVRTAAEMLKQADDLTPEDR